MNGIKKEIFISLIHTVLEIIFCFLFQPWWWIHLHHNNLQHFSVSCPVWTVFVLFCYSWSIDALRTSIEILYCQVCDLLIFLARYWINNSIKLQNVHLLFVGVGLAILEKAEVISPITDNNGLPTSAGTVSAGYQNFLICIEMFCAAIALRYAFPHRVYAQGCVTDSRGRTVTMQSISSSLKVSLHFYILCVTLYKYTYFNYVV